MATYDSNLGLQKGHAYADLTVRQVDERVHLLQSDIAPITTILMQLSRGKRATNPKVEWIERETLPHTTASDGGNNDTALTLDILNPEFCKPGDHLIVQATGELAGPVIGKDVANGTVEIAAGGRGILGTGAAVIPNGARIIIMRGNIQEGGFAADQLVQLPSTHYNYIEPTSTTYGNTDLLELAQTYANVHSWRDLRSIKMKDHMEDLEKKVHYGFRGVDTTGKQAKWFMGGLINQFITQTIETVNVGSGGTKQFTKKQWETFIRRLFTYNKKSSRRKVVFCSAEVLEAISDFKYQALQLRNDDMMINTAVFSYRTSFGIVDLVHDRFLSTEFGTDWYAVGVDLRNVEWLSYVPQTIREHIEERRSHSREDEIYQVNSMKVFNDATHGIFRVIAT